MWRGPRVGWRSATSITRSFEPHSWTPVEVAVRAANLLADRAAAVNANVRGIEHRPGGFVRDMPDGFVRVTRGQISLLQRRCDAMSQPAARAELKRAARHA